MVIDGSASDQLNLRNPRDGLEILLKDGCLVFPGFVVSVSISFAGRIKRLRSRESS